MRAFTKRIIWFFGFWSLILLDELVHFTTTGERITDLVVTLIFFAALLMPLLFMHDDEEISKRGTRK